MVIEKAFKNEIIRYSMIDKNRVLKEYFDFNGNKTKDKIVDSTVICIKKYNSVDALDFLVLYKGYKLVS